ncbi:flavodoxin [Pseudothauera rhizosphaerae]|uniref:Flavodoxin n=1 Tax=Pseudothauera rhizosphaerae TaxID=2565932 RepID=A0A4S4AJ08_9RHOO|nr:flavodoxin [Pseudothauera rhizosphaerae]THF59367.1 flavodoxin [Pseudothauera rhizosphaerae]
MSRIGIFYGSSSGVTKAVAEKIAQRLGEDRCDLFSMEEDFVDFDEMLDYDYLLLGCSTWGSGEVQNDWRDPLLDLDNDKPDFSGKTIAVFGAGDYVSHGEQFISALGILHDKFKARGATLVGSIPTDGYTYKYSFAERDGKFIGLGFDDVNEADKTDGRIDVWLAALEEHLPVAEEA